MCSIGENHDSRGKSASQSATKLSIRFSTRVQGEQLRYPDTEETGDDLAQDSIAWLREGRVDRAEFNNCRCTLLLKNHSQPWVVLVELPLCSRIRLPQLTKLPTITVASRASKEGTRFETDATKATPQNAPSNDHKATTMLPIGLGGLSRYPSIWATGLGTSCHLGAGTNGFKYRSISKFQVVGWDSVTGPCGDGAMLDFCCDGQICSRLR